MKKFSFVWHYYHSIFSAKTQSKITLDNLARMYKHPTKQTFKCSAKAADPYSFIIICLYEKINKVVKFERFPVKMKEKLDAPKNRRRRANVLCRLLTLPSEANRTQSVTRRNRVFITHGIVFLCYRLLYFAVKLNCPFVYIIGSARIIPHIFFGFL